MYHNITDIPDTQTYYCNSITVINCIKELKATNKSSTAHNLGNYDVQMTMNDLLKDLPGNTKTPKEV
eukprot:3895604-Ditylum_brightwellii.AAC.1